MAKIAAKRSKKASSRSSRSEQASRTIGGHESSRSKAEGHSLPPAPKLGGDVLLRTKSGSYVLTSPAKSDHSVKVWSRAFKKS